MSNLLKMIELGLISDVELPSVKIDVRRAVGLTPSEIDFDR